MATSTCLRRKPETSSPVSAALSMAKDPLPRRTAMLTRLVPSALAPLVLPQVDHPASVATLLCHLMPLVVLLLTVRLALLVLPVTPMPPSPVPALRAPLALRLLDLPTRSLIMPSVLRAAPAPPALRELPHLVTWPLAPSLAPARLWPLSELDLPALPPQPHPQSDRPPHLPPLAVGAVETASGASLPVSGLLLVSGVRTVEYKSDRHGPTMKVHLA